MTQSNRRRHSFSVIASSLSCSGKVLFRGVRSLLGSIPFHSIPAADDTLSGCVFRFDSYDFELSIVPGQFHHAGRAHKNSFGACHSDGAVTEQK